MATIDKITGFNQFHVGDVVTEGVFNQISEILIKAGYIDIDPADESEIAALVDQESKANAQLGDYAYLSADGKIMFGETYGEEDTVFGVVGDNDGNSVLIFSLYSLSTDFETMEIFTGDGKYGYSSCWSYNGSSLIGSFREDGTRTTEGSSDEAFTIKSPTSDTNALGKPGNPGFDSDFGNATGKQRTLAMAKNYSYVTPYNAGIYCYNFNPIMKKLNLKGLWYLPLPCELNIYYNHSLIFDRSVAAGGNIDSQWRSSWTSLSVEYDYPTGDPPALCFSNDHGEQTHVMRRSRKERFDYNIPVIRL